MELESDCFFPECWIPNREARIRENYPAYFTGWKITYEVPFRPYLLLFLTSPRLMRAEIFLSCSLQLLGAQSVQWLTFSPVSNIFKWLNEKLFLCTQLHGTFCNFQKPTLDLPHDRRKCVEVRFVLWCSWTGNSYFTFNNNDNLLCSLVCGLRISRFYFMNSDDIIITDTNFCCEILKLFPF